MWYGSIDATIHKAFVWNRALKPAEVASLYASMQEYWCSSCPVGKYGTFPGQTTEENACSVAEVESAELVPLITDCASSSENNIDDKVECGIQLLLATDTQNIDLAIGRKASAESWTQNDWNFHYSPSDRLLKAGYNHILLSKINKTFSLYING